MAKDYPLRQDLLHQTKALKMISRLVVKNYRKAASTSPSRLEAHTAFFRLSIFDICLLRPFGKELICIL